VLLAVLLLLMRNITGRSFATFSFSYSLVLLFENCFIIY
jgi:hypothetical protein